MSDDAFKILDRIVVQKDANIFREGDGGMRAYIVQSGAVEIWREIDDERVTYATVEPGGIFGEMALIDDSTRTANATALDATVCIVINRVTFKSKLQGADPFLAGLLRIMAGNIRSLHQEQSTADSLEELEEVIEIVDESNG
jgi:CRP/FNR family transcriptional regulator, cyclic AMP receptor protein